MKFVVNVGESSGFALGFVAAAAAAAAVAFLFREKIQTTAFSLGYRAMTSSIGKASYLQRLAKFRSISTAPHSIVQEFGFSTFKVKPVCYNADNYGYLIVDSDTNQAGFVDVGDADAAYQAYVEYGCEIPFILTTHYHWDHSAGNLGFIEKIGKPTKVFASGAERAPIEGTTETVNDGYEFSIGKTKVKVLSTPCHTQGHVMYLLNDECLFTGDAVFRGGCGRFFEGTASQMLDIVNKVSNECDDDVTIFNGHEYTLDNLKFARWAFPTNEEILVNLKEVELLRSKNESTLPSTLGLEKRTNPWFLAKNDVALADELRTQKNEGVHKL